MGSETFRFGAFCLVPARRELFLNGVSQELGTRAFDVLLALVRRRGDLATKDELMAEVWSGRVVEENNLQAQVSALRKVLARDLSGAHILQTVPGRGYRFLAPIEHPQPAQLIVETAVPIKTGGTALQLPDGPSIAVLPFVNMSGDPEHEYFVDEVVDDIITSLSHFHSLFVIARNSSFAYKGGAVDVKRVGRELGVRYVLEGSARKEANRVRIVAQLIDSVTAAHISAERFDGELKDIFDLQEEIAASVAGAIMPRIERSEMERARRKPTENLDAYGYFMRASACIYQWTTEKNEEALRLLNRAIELDPNFAAAYGLATQCYCLRKSYGPPDGDRELAIGETDRLARRAVELGKDDALALCCAAYALAYVVRELDDGAAFIDRALALNPNLARAWNYSGWIRIWLGEPEIAIEHLARAMRLSPIDPALHAMQAATASAHFFAGRYDEASSWAEKALREQPNNLDVIGSLAMSDALAGQLEKARRGMARLVMLSPGRRLSNIHDRMSPFRRPEDAAKVEEAARRAGLPE